MSKTSKNIFSLIACLLTICSLLSNSYASENLKLLYDQYRESYNKFTKALEDNNDQKYVNQLVEKYKQDYNVYHKALDNSTKSPNIFSIPPQTSKEINHNSISTNNERFISPLLYKKIKIKINGIYKTLNVPLLNPKLLKEKVIKPKNKLKKITDNKIALVRINESNFSVQDDIQFSAFPDIPIDINDTIKKDGIEKLNQMYKKMFEPNATVSEIQNLSLSITSNYASYPDICSYTQLFYAEMYMKKYYWNGFLCKEVNGLLSNIV